MSTRAEEVANRKRAAQIGSPLNLAMLLGGAWAVYAGATWLAALGVFVMLWGWISYATRACETLTAEVAEEIEDTLNGGVYADANAVSNVTQALEQRIDELEAQVQELQKSGG